MKQPFLAAIEDVWNAENDSKTWFNESLFVAYNKQLLPSVQGNHTPEVRSMLQNNVSRFAGWKTNAVVQQLLDAKRLSKNDKAAYTTLAKAIINTHGSYLGAEYQAALRRNNTALQWAQFNKEKHLYPNIQWLPSRSSNPDVIHRGYWNRIWPQDAEFWKTNQPGNRWGCKCSWKTTDAAPTDNNDVTVIEASKGLDNNPGTSKEIFTETHPYFTNASTDWIKNAGPLRNVDEICFVPLKTDKGNKYLAHYNEVISKSNADTFTVAQMLADLGYEVKLLPEVKNDVKLRERYFGKEYSNRFKTKSPDSITNKLITEFKYCNLSQLGNNINNAAHQSDNIIIVLKDSAKIKYIKDKILPSCLKKSQNIKSIIIVIDGKDYKLY